MPKVRISMPSGFVLPLKRGRYRLCCNGFKYYFSLRKNKWQLKFRRNGLRVAVASEYEKLGVVGLVRVNGQEWCVGAYGDGRLKNWYEKRHLPHEIPSQVVVLVNSVLAQLVAPLHQLWQEQHLAAQRRQALQSSVARRRQDRDIDHFNKVIEQVSN